SLVALPDVAAEHATIAQIDRAVLVDVRLEPLARVLDELLDAHDLLVTSSCPLGRQVRLADDREPVLGDLDEQSTLGRARVLARAVLAPRPLARRRGLGPQRLGPLVQRA